MVTNAVGKTVDASNRASMTRTTHHNSCRQRGWWLAGGMHPGARRGQDSFQQGFSRYRESFRCFNELLLSFRLFTQASKHLQNNLFEGDESVIKLPHRHKCQLLTLLDSDLKFHATLRVVRAAADEETCFFLFQLLPDGILLAETLFPPRQKWGGQS